FVASLAILVLVLGPLGYLLSPALVRFATADASVAAHALPYLRVMFVGGAPLFIMFMVTGALQAAGQPKLPLKLGVLTTVLNIVLSTLFITGIGPWPRMGTAGAALGTCLAPVITVGIAIILIFRRKTLFLPPRRLRLPDWRVLKSVALIGVPTGLQAVLLNLGGALLISKIGMLPQGAAAQAAYTIGYIQLFSLVMWVSFGLRVASATIMGQNIGANQPDRGTRGVYVAALMGMTWAAGMGAVFWLFPGVLLGAFRATAEPLFGYGASLLKVLAFSGVLQVVTLAFTGGLQGAGDTRTPMFIAFITQIVILLGLAQMLDMTGHLSIYTLWAAVFVAHAARFLLTGAVFYRGRWKGIELKV
ncbi:MAG: MATE family efflux transporter, partial [Candidatus Hydrogenedentes bacterium]|nr:MATE family efflux transporter [Candidatus Hydrogenedentota bacterium]